MNQELISFFGKLAEPENSVEIRRKVLEYAGDFIGGEWKHLNENEMEVVQMTGGQSNLLYLVSSLSALSSPTPSRFLIRLHCQQPLQVFTDTVVFSILSERQIGPKLYGFFPGGRLEEFLPSETLDYHTVVDPENAKKIAAMFPKLHALEIPIQKKPRAIQMIRDFLEECRVAGGDVFELVKGSVEFPDIPKQVTVDQLENDVAKFEEMCSVFNDTVVFCHNDLWSANILKMNDAKEIVFIDFEYCSYNWRSFDLCMHLSENAFNYNVPFPPGVHVDQKYFENHPNLRIFAESYIESLGDKSLKLADLEQEIDFFLPLVNMLWATWSLKNLWSGKQDDVDLAVAASNRLAVFYHFMKRSERIFEKKRGN